MHQCVVIIPALNPEAALIQYVEKLIEKDVQKIIIVNDGSDSVAAPIFATLADMDNCTVLTHEMNQGKGQSLKTAFQYVNGRQSSFDYVVTADADEQHTVEDVLQVLKKSIEKQSGLVLGVRNFKEEQVPAKNAFGNRLTSRVFQILFKKYLSDTQTGLRSFAVSELDWLLDLKGNRFEYEMNMLIYAIQNKIPIHEQSIQTIYFGEKQKSHYKSFHDSVQIAKLLANGFLRRRSLIEYRD